MRSLNDFSVFRCLDSQKFVKDKGKEETWAWHGEQGLSAEDLATAECLEGSRHLHFPEKVLENPKVPSSVNLKQVYGTLCLC